MIPLVNLPAPFLTDEKALMPLGLLYLGASIEHAGRDCKILDLAGDKDYITKALDQLSELKTDVVGIGLTSSQVPLGRRLVHAIKKEYPKIRIIGGGPHVTHAFQASRRQSVRCEKLIRDLNDTYNVLVMGDAEKAILKAAEPDSPKLIDATHKLSPYYVEDDYLDTIPFPARHLIDVDSYSYNLGMVTIKENNAINIMSQRGCPYSCRFCASRMDKYGRTLRRTSNFKIVEEIKHLHKTYGYTYFTFYDDELNVDPNLNTLLDQLKDVQMELGVAFKFRAFVKANLCTREQMKAMADTGFKVIATGAESGSERILKNMNKKATKEINTKVVEWVHEFGMYSKSIMSLGHPGETPETLAETEAWLDQVKLSDVNFTIIECLPSSVYFDNAIQNDKGVWVYTVPENGDKLYDIGIDWTEEVHFHNAAPGQHYNPTVYTDALSQDDLMKWHTYFSKKFK